MELTYTELVVMIVILAVVFGYVGVSALLLRNPTLIHKKKLPKFTCVHISHRGGAGEYLENTMTAFRHAVSLGTDMLETDCQLSKDGEVVVCHDNNLHRVTGQKLHISDTAYKDLPLLKPSLKLDFDPSITTAPCEDRRLVLLKDLFREFPALPINIDIKEDNDELIHKVVDLIEEYKRKEITVVGNFREAIQVKVRALDPDVWTLCSKKRVFRIYLYYYLGLLPFMRIEETFFEIVMPSLLLRKENQFLANRSKFWIYAIKLLNWLIMRPALFEHLKKRGIQNYIWVLNHESEFEAAFAAGATGVMTDYPTRLRHYLDTRPQYRSRSQPQQCNGATMHHNAVKPRSQ